VFDVSNDGINWHPAVRLTASTGTAFVVTNGEAVLTGQNAGMVEHADHATFRASPAPADGAVFRIISPPGEFRYSSSTGAGWADDDDTLLKPASVNVANNGRAYSTRASEHAATFAAARAMKGLLGRAKHVHIESHTTFGDGGGGIFDVKPVGSYVDNNGTILVNGTAAGVRRVNDSTANIAFFGAQSGGAEHAATNTAAVASALAVLRANGGGTLFVPEGDFHGTNLGNTAFLSIDFDDCHITGTGPRSRLIVDDNTHVIVHVCHKTDLSEPYTATIDNFEMSNVAVVGTGVYEFNVSTYGRNVLLRGTTNARVHHCDIIGAPMIGVASEGSSSFTDLSHNYCKDNKYTALNLNGLSWGSLISYNRIEGTDGSSNSAAIQACGHSIVHGNTIFGSLTNYANAGGITWGEGAWDGTGEISGNLIMHVNCGIRAWYHGPVNIHDNTIINARVIAGILIVEGSCGGYVIPESHCSVTNNTLINCYSYQIAACGNGTKVIGNTCRYLESPAVMSGPTVIDVIKPAAGIRVYSGKVTVVGNVVDGGYHGIQFTLGDQNGSINGNTIFNTTTTRYSFIDAAFKVAACPDRESRNLGGKSVDLLVSPTLPSEGYYPIGSRWHTDGSVATVSDSAIVTDARIDALNGALVAGATEAVLVGLADFVFGQDTKIGIALDNYAYHWTEVSSVTGHTVTLADAIPAERSCADGAAVYVVCWRAKPVIDADQIGGSSTSVTLTSDPSAVILAVTIPNLLPSHYYTATLGSRVSLWRDATPLNSGSVDTTRDIAIQTNSSGVAAVTLLGTEYVDVSRLPTELVSATMTISATTGGFTIYATRTPGVACSAKAKWWLTGLEDLGEIAT
jgi:hypothetical protein